MNSDFLKSEILSDALSDSELSVIQPVAIGETSKHNELLMFIKPEIFATNESTSIGNSLDLIFNKIREFDAEIQGIVLVGGRRLEKAGSMDRHYGLINELSRSASNSLSREDRNFIADKLGNSEYNYRLLGGHEFLSLYPQYDPESLDELWATKESLKIRSGFYVQAYTVNKEVIILVNGFHPAQLAHFTDKSHKIVLMLIHSNTDWAVLRDQMIGETFPDRAVSGSIRGSLYAEPSKYGFHSVSIANNGVHLSAGPFEAMFEISNFFGDLTGIDISQEQPLVLKKMLERGLEREKAMKALNNPVIHIDKQEQDLFSATEHMNTNPAVSLYEEDIDE